jgi:diacylglycerol kinase (ATP)
MLKENPSPLSGKCIVNPAAARNKWIRRKRLRRYLQDNLPYEIIDDCENKESVIKTAKEKSLDNDIIVAIGGDGTIIDIIQGIINSKRGYDILLGLIPFGSGNAFRKSFGISKKLRKALNTLSEGNISEMDLIDIDGSAASFASIGATAQVTQEKLQHTIPGLAGHLLASRIMVGLPRKKQEIELIDGLTDEGEPFERKVLNLNLYDCVVGKTNYFGYSWRVAPKARLDDGYLDITLFETPWLKYYLFFSLIYLGFYQRTQKHFKAKKMIIRGKDLPVQYNGEFLGIRDEVTFNVLPRALKVISSKK